MCASPNPDESVRAAPRPDLPRNGPEAIVSKTVTAAPSSRRYAQTNVQLFEELRELGYAEADIGKLAQAYGLSQKLLAGKFRGSGRPFLAHVVGSASIMARHGASLDALTAGLLHASYEFGDFGTGRGGMTPAKRDQVRRQVGDSVERLVADYAAMAWSPGAIARHIEQAANAGESERDVLLMRLANCLEDALCDNLDHSGPGKRESVLATLPPSAELAEELGLAGLAEELKACFEHASAPVSVVSLPQAADLSYAVVPASYAMRLGPRLARLYRRLYSFVRRASAARRRTKNC